MLFEYTLLCNDISALFNTILSHNIKLFSNVHIKNDLFSTNANIMPLP